MPPPASSPPPHRAAGRQRRPRGRHRQASSAHAKTVPLRLVSISPAGRRHAPPTGPPGSPSPTTSRCPPRRRCRRSTPAVAGSWTRHGRHRRLHARLRVPGRHQGHGHRRGGTGSDDRASTSSTFTTGKYSTLRLQEILAQLGYLPLTWTPAAGGRCPATTRRRRWRRPTTRRPAPSPGSPGTRPRCTSSGSRAAPTPSRPARSPRSRATTRCVTTETMSPAVWASLLKAAAADDMQHQRLQLRDRQPAPAGDARRSGTTARRGSPPRPTPGSRSRRPRSAPSRSTRSCPSRSCRAPTRTGRTTRTRCSGCRTSTAGTRCTTSPAAATGGTSPWAAWSCRGRPPSRPTTCCPTGRWSRSPRSAGPGPGTTGSRGGRSAGRAEIGHVGARRVRGEPLAHQRVVAGHQVRAGLAGQSLSRS